MFIFNLNDFFYNHINLFDAVLKLSQVNTSTKTIEFAYLNERMNDKQATFVQ